MSERIGGFTMESLKIKDSHATEAFELALREAAPLMLEALQNLENDAGQIPDHAWKLCQQAITAAGGSAK